MHNINIVFSEFASESGNCLAIFELGADFIKACYNQ